MINSFQVKILSIYLIKEKEKGEGNEKKYFYIQKENLEKKELIQENLENTINEDKNKIATTIVNLFIVTGDEYNISISGDLSLEKVLGFVPNIRNLNDNENNYIINPNLEDIKFAFVLMVK